MGLKTDEQILLSRNQITISIKGITSYVYSYGNMQAFPLFLYLFANGFITIKYLGGIVYIGIDLTRPEFICTEALRGCDMQNIDENVVHSSLSEAISLVYF